MPTRQDLSDILSTLNSASDPVHAAKRIVVYLGGDWTDAKGHLGLFEVQIAGLSGIGPSPNSAIDDWMSQARDVMSGPQPAAR